MMTKNTSTTAHQISKLSIVQNISFMLVAMREEEEAKGNPLKIEVMAEYMEKMGKGMAVKIVMPVPHPWGQEATHIMSGKISLPHNVEKCLGNVSDWELPELTMATVLGESHQVEDVSTITSPNMLADLAHSDSSNANTTYLDSCHVTN